MPLVPLPCILSTLDTNLEAVFCKVVCEKLVWNHVVSQSGKNDVEMAHLCIVELDTENIG
jgi:hypothetical protein